MKYITLIPYLLFLNFMVNALIKEKNRTDIDALITFRNGTSECKGENCMMIVMFTLGVSGFYLGWLLN